MTDINATEEIISQIENHEHYCSCLNGYDYNKFKDDFSKIRRIRDCYNGFGEEEINLINALKNEKTKNSELENKKQIAQNKINNLKDSLNKELEEIKLENEIKLKEIKNNYEFIKLDKKCENELIDEDIENLNNIIETLKNKYNQIVYFKKKEELNKIRNEYKLKLIHYKIEKEYGILLAKKKLEAEKEIEFNDLKNKSELVQKIISMVKSICLNN